MDEALTRWLNRQQANGMSSAIRNEHRQELVGFGNWCVETHRHSVNPFCKVPKADAKIDRRRQRRSMTEAELLQVLDVARWRPLAEYGRETAAPDDQQSEGAGKHHRRSNWKMAALTLAGLQAAVVCARERLAKNPDSVAKPERLGRERALIYKTLVLTGLRKGELASLTIGQLIRRQFENSTADQRNGLRQSGQRSRRMSFSVGFQRSFERSSGKTKSDVVVF
jgi:integrase